MRTPITMLAISCLLLSACDGASGAPDDSKQPAKAAKLTHVWPPVMGKPYPDYSLVDQTGKQTKISDFKGKVILVEVIGMDCPACQAFAGAKAKGGFAGGRPQAGLDSIHVYAERFAGVKLGKQAVYIQLLLYDMKRKAAPTPADGAAWAKHFGMDRKKKQVVLVGTQAYIGAASFKMIPGFHLIDRKGVLRGDSSGHHPKENLYKDLLPRMGKLVKK